MGKLEATAAMLRAARRLRKDEAIQRFIQKSAAGKLRIGQPRLPAAKPEPKIGDPTPERVDRAVETIERQDGSTFVDTGAVVQTKAPPFNSRVLPLLQRYADSLGPEAILVLEKLYEVGRKGAGGRGLAAGYDGIKVDASRTSFEHLSAAESDAHNLFHAAMRRMPRELRLIVLEVLFEEGRGRKPLTVMRDELNLNNEQYQRAGIVTLLRIVAWCVQVEFLKGGRHGKGRKSKQQL